MWTWSRAEMKGPWLWSRCRSGNKPASFSSPSPPPHCTTTTRPRIRASGPRTPGRFLFSLHHQSEMRTRSVPYCAWGTPWACPIVCRCAPCTMGHNPLLAPCLLLPALPRRSLQIRGLLEWLRATLFALGVGRARSRGGHLTRGRFVRERRRVERGQFIYWRRFVFASTTAALDPAGHGRSPRCTHTLQGEDGISDA